MKRMSWQSPKVSAITGESTNATAHSNMGKDTHALSGPAAAHRTRSSGGEQRGDDSFRKVTVVTPPPVIFAGHSGIQPHSQKHLADGIVVTSVAQSAPRMEASKYNPTNGGPADTDVTRWIEGRANELLRAGNADVKASAVRQSDAGSNYAPGRLRFYHTFATSRTSLIWKRFGGRPSQTSGPWIHWAEPRGRIGSRSIPIYGLEITVRPIQPLTRPSHS